jgi:flagellar hook-associated protein 2
MASSTVTLSGIASGFDWSSFIDQMIGVSRVPQQRLLADQTKLNQKNSAYSNIKTQLTTLQTRNDELKDPTLYDSRTASSSDASIATASVAKGAALGSFTFNITQLATASKINGATNAGKALSQTNDVSGVTLSSAGLPTAITGGTFTVNGKQVTIATSDTLASVFSKIATATNNEVTATYDPTQDKISLTGAGEIILGSATDTSNFLQATRLNNNGTNTISSSMALGSVRQTATLNAANFDTTISDGGAGVGKFKINGVEISFNASSDNLNDVINRINISGAGVTAGYDALNDRFVLTNKATGDIGIAMEDVTGNFLAATKLSSGTLAHGKNLIYTVDGSDPIVSQSNTITETSSGIAGLSVTALKENSTVTVGVSTDTSKIKTAINSFIEAYNRVQSLIDSQTASSTDAKGKVTAGVLAGESDAAEISSNLRSAIYSTISGLGGTLKHLQSLGIETNGNNNSIALKDEAKLDAALSTNLNGVKDFFTNSTLGLSVKLDSVIEKIIGDDGSLVTHQNTLNTRSKAIDQQVADMERRLTAERDRLTASFVAMETAQAKINQELQYLTKQFSS